MAGIAKPASLQEAIRQSRRIQIITVIWMSAEVVLSLYASWNAGSPVLLAFGGDSLIELFSATVVLWRFGKAEDEQTEKYASRIAGILLFSLGIFVIVVSMVTLLRRIEPAPSRLGIGVLMLAAVFMPWLARKKRELAMVTGSAALKADAAESAMCGYLSLIGLVGLVLNAVWGLGWVDPVAALCLLPFIAREGREALQGKRDCC